MIHHRETVIKLKNRILDVAFRNQRGYISSSFSIMDILVCLYYDIISADDEVILSKGHAALGLYSVLEDLGKLQQGELDTFGKYGSRLSLMAGGEKVPGVIFSTGSLGVGLSEAVGVAYAKKLKQEKGRVFVIVGDGELNEGSVWEGLISAAMLKLDNFVCIIDHNKSSAVWRDSGLNFEDMFPAEYIVNRVDGHDNSAICGVLCNSSLGRPLILIADTIKGKGCKSTEENAALWHSKAPSEEEYAILKGELYA